MSLPRHRPKRIEWVQQRLSTDCGIACVAMLTKSLYEAIFDTFQMLGVSINSGVFSDEVINVLEFCGYEVDEVFNLIRRPALVGVTWKDDGGGHFVVWDGYKVLDPKFGIYSKTDLKKHASVDEIWSTKLST